MKQNTTRATAAEQCHVVLFKPCSVFNVRSMERRCLPQVVLTRLAFSEVEGELGVNLEVEVGAPPYLETRVLEVVAGKVARHRELVWTVDVDRGNLQRSRSVQTRG